MVLERLFRILRGKEEPKKEEEAYSKPSSPTEQPKAITYVPAYERYPNWLNWSKD